MSKPIQTIDRQLDVLEAVAADTRGLGVTEIAKEVNLPKSTVHRILQTLCMRHYLQKSESTDKYTLSHKFLSVSAQYYAGLDLRIVASPYVRELSSSTGATVHIAIQSGDLAIYIEKYKPFAYSCSYSEIGKSIPLYCSSIGKVLLSGLSKEQFHYYIDHLQALPFTANTITKEVLIEQVNKFQSTQIAYDDGEHDILSFCVGTAIRNFQGDIIAALSISSTKKELVFSPSSEKALLQCARQISKIFGYEGES